MSAHWKYLKYVLVHKWWVFWFGLRIGNIPIWRLIIHDWQKFLPIEWTSHALSFYGPWKKEERPQWLKEAFDRAWLHHIHHGPHHWQYWILGEKALQMPEIYAREMLADWIGAGKTITGKVEVKEWYYKNRQNINIHDNTRVWIERMLEYVDSDACPPNDTTSFSTYRGYNPHWLYRVVKILSSDNYKRWGYG